VLCHAGRWLVHKGVPVAQPSPSRTRSPEPQVVGEALANDARTATPPRGVVENVVTSPPVADVRVGTPPRVAEVVGTSAGDVRVTASPTIIDVDPIRTVPSGGEDLVGDLPHIDLAPGGPETSGTRYHHLHLRAQGCHSAPLIGITPLGRRTDLKISRTCRPCGPASSPSTTR
jgi:hypothetical protein